MYEVRLCPIGYAGHNPQPTRKRRCRCDSISWSGVIQYITICDIDTVAGEALAHSLRAREYQAAFVETDVTSWTSQVNAFKSAIEFSALRSVGVVLLFAGIGAGTSDLFYLPSTLEKDPFTPSTATWDINLTGVYYSPVLAGYYFRLPPTSSSPAFKKTVISMSSTAGYWKQPVSEC